MLRNYLRIAFRTLRRHRGHTALNLAGLAVGLAGALLIGLYVRHEATYDRFHEDADRLYRLTVRFGEFGLFAGVPAGAVEPLAAAYPEVEATARVYRQDEAVRIGRTLRAEERFYYADPSVLDLFTFPLRAGDPATALAEPHTVVLSHEAAARYFGRPHAALGETLTLGDGRMLRVTGVAEPVPSNTHLRWDLLASFASLPAEGGRGMARQGLAYVRLRPDASAEALQAKLDALAAGGSEAVMPVTGFYVDGLGFGLEAVTDIHLHTEATGNPEPIGDVRTLWTFAVIAAFLVLLACVNYMNLATARSVRRAREVGVRKVLGARRAQLVAQFLGEAVALALGALVLAVLLAELALPLFNALAGKALTIRPLGEPALLGVLVLAGVGVGLVAGSYPAFVLSRFVPARVLKGGGGRAGGARVRQVLVVFQFGVSIALLLGTAVLVRQIDYLRSKPLGYDTAHVVALPLPAGGAAGALEADVRALPGVRHVSLANGTPLQGWQFMHEHDGEAFTMRVLTADAAYVETLGMTLVAGRTFDPARAADSTAVILNETAARRFGVAVGDVLAGDARLLHEHDEPVVGIVSDFHVASLHEPIAPTVLSLIDGTVAAGVMSRSLVLRLAPAAASETLARLGELWARHVPDRPFSPRFLDEMVRRQYEAEERLARLVGAFAGLAVFVACLGLFGLAAFTAEQRTKEIGIRKVLGATPRGLVVLLTKDFLRLVVIAFVLAAPLAYLATERWLAGFAYRAAPSWTLFAGVAVGAVLLALAAVGYQALRAALADPARSLRYE